MKMNLLVLLLVAFFAVSNVYADDKVKYDCADISKSDADKYFKEGHDYLDSDKNKIPCDEVTQKPVTPPPPAQSQTPPPPPVAVSPPSPKIPHVGGNAKGKKGGKCKTVKGYTRKDGKRVKGYTRCK